MSVKEKAKRAGAKMRAARAGQASGRPQSEDLSYPLPRVREIYSHLEDTNLIPRTEPLPKQMPLSTFLHANPTVEQREALSPGITGADRYKNLSSDGTGPVLVNITGNPTHVTPATNTAALQAKTDAIQQAQVITPDVKPQQKTVTLGTVLREYGPAVTNSLYPGIFNNNGWSVYQKRYGTTPGGELLVPSYGDFSSAPVGPTPAAIPTVPEAQQTLPEQVGTPPAPESNAEVFSALPLQPPGGE